MDYQSHVILKERVFGDLKRDLTHPKATLKVDKGKTYVEALKKSGQILEGALPYGAAAMAGLETGSPAAAIGAFKGTKSQMKEAKELIGSGVGDKRKQRGLLVSKLMKKHGVSLAEASRMIKKKVCCKLSNHTYMEFRYVPLDELNTAKRKVVKRMIKNAKNEPRYALTTDQAIVYDEYLKELVDLNDKLYNLQLQIESETTPAFRGIFTDLTGLLSKTKQLNTTDYSSRELSDLEEQRDNLQQRITGISENTSKLVFNVKRDTRLINNEKKD